MSFEIGQRLTATIISNGVRTMGDSDVVSIKFQADGETEESLIFLTPKSMGMARAKLRVCGFDPDKENLGILVTQPTRLAGRVIPIEVDEYNNRKQYKIPTSDVPSGKRLNELDKLLKAAKKDGGEDPLSSPEPVTTAVSEVPDGDLPF